MKTFREILISALALMVIAGVVTAALAGTNELTQDTIAAKTAEKETEARKEVIDANQFDAATLSTKDGKVTYYVAKKDGAVVGYVFTAESSGKSSGLVVMTGIGIDGTITGVRITEDNETAGYVDKVVEGGFLDKLTEMKADKTIEFKKDIDAVSQATKTSKGVCDAVNQAIDWYKLVMKGGKS